MNAYFEICPANIVETHASPERFSWRFIRGCHVLASGNLYDTRKAAERAARRIKDGELSDKTEFLFRDYNHD